MMESYEKLYAHLPFFEKRAKQREQGVEMESVIADRDGLGAEYIEEMNRFIASIEDTEFVDFQYQETLERYGAANGKGLGEALPEADPALLRAAFTYMLRAERFSTGAWAAFEEKGMFLTALRRLGEEFGYPPPSD